MRMTLARLLGAGTALCLLPSVATAAAQAHPVTPLSSVSPTGSVSSADIVATRARQTASLRMHPQIAQPGAGVRKAGAARSSMSAVFRPVRPGRTVVLQRRSGDRWVTADRGRQNARGIAEFNAAYRRNGNIQTYRAYAVRVQSLPRIRTAAARTDVRGDADFTDQFGGSRLGSAWSHRYQDFNTANLRKCSVSGVPRAAKVDNGVVRLSVRVDPGPRPKRSPRCKTAYGTYKWRANGHISTNGTKSFRYGYAAARIRFQPRRGQHGAFWMQPQTKLATEGSARRTGAEIDVIEWFGGNHPQGGLASFAHDYPKDGKPGVTPRKTGGFIKNPGRFGSGWAKKFHVFSVEWTPTRYIYRIDGRETFRTGKGVSGRPEFLILSLQSSDYELQYLGGERRLPQHMYVDWVRYWKR